MRRWEAKIQGAIAKLLQAAHRPGPRYFLIAADRPYYHLAKVENNVTSFFDHDTGGWVSHPAVVDEQEILEPDVLEISASLAHHLLLPVTVADDG